jgi:bacteriocin-like protein
MLLERQALDVHAKETVMRLIGKLKEEVEKAETAEKKKELIEEAGMELDDEELEQVSGGLGNLKNPIVYIGKAL